LLSKTNKNLAQNFKNVNFCIFLLLKTGQKILVFPIFDDFGEKKNVTQVGGLITHPFWPGVNVKTMWDKSLTVATSNRSCSYHNKSTLPPFSSILKTCSSVPCGI
jgi:hypothetical protein